MLQLDTVKMELLRVFLETQVFCSTHHKEDHLEPND